jgi:ketosteroid isomerase-like protein
MSTFNSVEPQIADKSKSEKSKDWYIRRDQIMKAHLAAETDHDIDAIMATYAPDGEVVFNGKVFDTLEQIRNLHLDLGFGGKGTLPDLCALPLRHFEAGDAIVIEFCLKGTHEGAFGSIKPTGKKVEMPAMVIYEFDDKARLKSERVYVDTTILLLQE